VPKYVLDTDTCIYWLKGNKAVEKKILEVGMENVSITVITECELFYGAFKSINIDKNLKTVRDLLERIKTLHTNEGVSFLYGKTKAELESKGQIIDDADLLIACIAKEKDCALVTNNIKHFKRVSGLAIENWSNIVSPSS